MQKRIIAFLAIIIGISLFLSCAHEMPQDSGFEHSDEKIEHAAPIDRSIFTPEESMVYSYITPYFCNIPGMVLLNDQEAHGGGMHMSYVNKADLKEYFFCFDALCNHTSCLFGYNGPLCYIENVIWSPSDGCLYATAIVSDPENRAPNDGVLYRVDMDTMVAKRVIDSNGEPLSRLYASESDIFVTRKLQTGGYEILRYHPQSGEVLSIQAPEGRAFKLLRVSGEVILVSFMDDPTLYQTDRNFSEYRATELPRKFLYLDQNVVVSAASADGEPVVWETSARSIQTIRVDTGEIQTLLSYDDLNVRVVGYGGGYVYFILNPIAKEDETQVEHCGNILYRVSTDGGKAEPMIDFSAAHTGRADDLYVYWAACYDGVVYCNVRCDTPGKFVEMYGTITMSENGEWVFSTLKEGDN
ncbi:MAG: hypothetical protein IJW40_06305 [Clostridia bacterium]|nr:hypothetical protein [Clostridia bacterium]